MPDRKSSERFARRPSVARRPFAVLSVAVVMACLFPGLSAHAQEPLALPQAEGWTLVANRSISVTLPEATGGTPPYTYVLSRGKDSLIPLWSPISFDPETLVLSATVPGHIPDYEEGRGNWPGKPSLNNGEYYLDRRVYYWVTDNAGATAVSGGAANEGLIEYSMIDFLPGFLPAQDDLNFTPDTAITPVTLQPTAQDTNYTYALTGLPSGLTFDPDTRELSGTPTEEGETTVTYTATQDNYSPTVAHTVKFAIIVAKLSPPAQDDLAYNKGTAIDPVTLPAATGGTTPYTYALTGPNGMDLSEVPGLTFDPDTRVLSGTPTKEGTTALRYTITDSAPVSVTSSFTVTVTEPMSVAAVKDQTYAASEAIDPVTLPAATGGTTPYTYALTGPNGMDLSEVPGLTFDPDTRVLSGTPTRAGTTTLTYTVTDRSTTPGRVTHTFTVTISVNELTPATAVEHRTYVVGGRVTEPLPAATGGIAPYTYALSGLPPGLTFDPDTRVLSGTPTEEGTTPLSYTITDSAPSPVRDTSSFIITVTAPGPISVAEVDDWTYAAGGSVTEPLPAATGGTPPHTYALTGPNGVDLSEVPGLAFDPATRELSGTPTRAGTTTLTYTVTDSADVRVTRTFDVTIIGPVFDADEEMADPTYAAGEAIRPETLPAATGAGTVTYALSGPNGAEVSAAVPGLTFDPDTRILSGTPTRAGTTTLTYTATDEYGNATRANFDVTVTGPRFDEEVEDRTYAVDEAITPLTLPAATGAGTVTYALSGPDGVDVGAAVPGLSFDPGTRVLSGTPTEEGETTLTYTATDGYDNDTPLTFVVTVTGVIPAALNEILLPEVVRAMADSTVGAIARRMGQAARGSAGSAAAGLSLGGQGGLAAALRTHGETVSEGRREFRELLSGSNFVLNAAGASGASPVTLWGSGEYRGLSGRSGTLDWDGELAGVHLGVDARLRPDLLAGVALSRLESGLDYEDAVAAGDGGLGTGAHEVELTGVHPYLWSAWKGLEVWATAGYGEGELGVTPKDRERRSSEVETRTVGVGGSGLLLERGVSTVRLKGEVMHSVLGVDDSTYIEGLEVEAIRVRMTVAAGQTRALAGGGVMEPSLEVGVRYDGGDGETGSGAEVGGGLSYRHPAWGITAGGRVRALVGHGGDQEEWGIEGHLGVSPGAGGQGLSLSLRPGYGDSGGGIRELWRQGVTGAGDRGAGDYRGRLEARLGYGLFLPGYAGVFTPYTGMTVGATDGYRIGVNWKAGARFDLDLLGERREPGGGPAEHALLLKGKVRF